MLDTEAVVKEGMQIAENLIPCSEVPHHDMATHRLLSRREGPHMDVVDLLDAGNAGHGALDLREVHVRRGALE